MTPELKEKLRNLANKYENKDFIKEDPSQFLYWYDLKGDGPLAVELSSFIAAMLAFGSRKQFIPKIQEILIQADGFNANKGGQTPQSIVNWLLAGASTFPHGTQKFYRFYSYDDMHVFFGELADIVKKYGSLGQAVQKKMQGGTDPTEGTDPSNNSKNPAEYLSSLFPKSKIVPKGKNSANKRIHMFLRWMVRQNSPVDIGIWTWVKPADLLIPLDVHVMQEAVGLGLLPQKASASRKTASFLTSAMEEVFPGDPARADFALFGLGIDDKI
ncbi:MAG: TIGR02757 family protein [Treponema sp.]|nr:TIGR02757 family protein [Treponema sp.]